MDKSRTLLGLHGRALDAVLHFLQPADANPGLRARDLAQRLVDGRGEEAQEGCIVKGLVVGADELGGDLAHRVALGVAVLKGERDT